MKWSHVYDSDSLEIFSFYRARTQLWSSDIKKRNALTIIPWHLVTSMGRQSEQGGQQQKELSEVSITIQWWLQEGRFLHSQTWATFNQQSFDGSNRSVLTSWLKNLLRSRFFFHTPCLCGWLASSLNTQCEMKYVKTVTKSLTPDVMPNAQNYTNSWIKAAMHTFPALALENDPLEVFWGCGCSCLLTAQLGEPCLFRPASFTALWDGGPQRLPFSCSPFV